MKQLTTLIIFLLAITMAAQTPAQIERITDNYDLLKLQELETQFQAEFQGEQKAVSLFRSAESLVNATLIRIDDDGTPIYFETHVPSWGVSTARINFLHSDFYSNGDDANVCSADPNPRSGWGLINAKKAAETIEKSNEEDENAILKELTLENGGEYEIMVHSDGNEPLMASISWTDPAGVPNSPLQVNSPDPVLVNDLDIRVEKVDGNDQYKPWKLTGVDSNGKGDNHVDPFERVDILNPESGAYRITVSHKGSLEESQDFSLIVTGYNHCAAESYYIDRVLGGQNNMTENHSGWDDGYGDYTDVILDVDLGVDDGWFSFAIYPDGYHPDADYHYEVWVDRYKDGNFYGHPENFMWSKDTTGVAVKDRFKIWCDHPIDDYTLRLVQEVQGCNGEVYQEIEDYTINIHGTCPEQENNLSTEGWEENSISIWPNPTDGLLSVKLDQDAKIKVYDPLGRELLRVTHLSGMTHLDLSRLESGLYFLEITTENKVIHEKIIIE